MIEFESVSKLYGLVNGLNDVSMSIGPGSYGLLGPNGSGKTTMINLITGQLKPTLGRVQVFGENPWGREKMLRRIGLCPAVDVLYSNVSAYEWVNYQTRLIGFDWNEARARSERALSLVGMTDAMHRQIGGYSLGMRQRTKLAQAIAHEPDLLILDEPFNGLDPIGRQQMTELLRDYLKQGRSVILASHVLHEVEEIDPDLLMLSHGRLLAQGPPKEIQQLLTDYGDARLAGMPDEGKHETGLPTGQATGRVADIFLRTSDNYRLAQILFDRLRLTSVILSPDEQELTIGTRQGPEVYQQICQVAAQEGLEFYEMRSADSSLDDLFSSLMKIHRGDA